MFLSHAFYDGDYALLSDISLPATDLGYHRGYSIFDFFRFDIVPQQAVEWYLDRFYRSAEIVNLRVPYDRDELRSICSELLRQNEVARCYIKLILSAGDSANGFHRVGPAKLLVIAMPYRPPSQQIQADGAKLISACYLRDMPEVKTTNYLMSARLADQMQNAEAVDVLYHDGTFISECSRSNVFVVKDGVLSTPDSGVLAGITRKKVISICQDRGYQLQQRPVQFSEISECQEFFITSTTKGIMPIIQIDDQVVGTGKVGPVTQALLKHPIFESV